MPGPKRHIETRLLINGELVESEKTFDLINPATLEPVAKVYEASEADTNAAVAAAKASFPAWSALSVEQRAVPLKKLAQLIRENHDELASLEAMSMGRPVTHFFDAMEAASRIEHYAEAGYEVQGTTSIQTPGYVNMTFRQPYGVVAAIIPWNYPLLFLAGKLAPALITGNTVVLKSSEKAPLTSAKIATLVLEAGFPRGVFNIITGFGNISGSILSHHMDVRALTFTGSGRTGRLIQVAATKSNLKHVLLELGGKSPAIVFADADLDDAVAATVQSMKQNSGQVCMANSRIYVQDSIAEKFMAAYQKTFALVTMGDTLDPATNHGPQADAVQHETVLRYIEDGKKVGKLVVGGEAATEHDGFFIRPTIFTEAPEDSNIMKEEIFGPVVNINTFETEEEVLAKANDTEFGLYASVFTKDIDRAMRFAKGLESGVVGINCTSPTHMKDGPFGGYKSSGSGREGYRYSMENFLETKAVCIKLGGSAGL
ncbi:aldehyde dehydrogenase [Mytilinidion resinicola]|uniref:aldehyde dehydrogenase (NAD(+)) n=1 Tax=Mytilinidion resinicola TaxID=574789 RepID=A0A6A6Z9X3_9PEZI|nr:aldehyde dehydrogenase [Mytilinidion resinicola]KAF2817075.1 aldehyde dehydrogenase [Mytilinidion resinicola]